MKRVPFLDLAVIFLTALYFAVPLIGHNHEVYFFLLISLASFFTLLITCKMRDLKNPRNSVILLVSLANLASLLFFAINQKMIFHGLSIGIILVFSLFDNPLVYLVSGSVFLAQYFSLLVMIKKWEFFEFPVLTVMTFSSLGILLFKKTRDRELRVSNVEETMRIYDESKKILLGESRVDDEGVHGARDGVAGLVSIDVMMAEIIKDVLHRLRSITRAEYVYLFRPVTSTGLRWSIAADSTEHDEKEDTGKEVDGGWEPIKVPYLLGREFTSDRDATGYIGFPFKRDGKPESIYSIPVFSKRSPVAVLYFEKHFAGSFSRIERESVAMGAEFLSRAFAVTNLLGEMQASNRTYTHFNEYVRDMLRAKGVTDVYPSAAGKVCDTLDAAAVCILVLAEGIGNFEVKAAMGEGLGEAYFRPGAKIDCTGTIIRWCMNNEIHRIINFREKGQKRISNLPRPLDTVSKDRYVIIFPFAGNIGKGRQEKGVVIVFGKDGHILTKKEVDSVKSIMNVTLLALPRAFDYDKLEGESRRDPLTGLLNKKELFVKLRKEISKAMRTKGVFSFLLLDIDDFKKLNDTCGHPFGDEVIVTVSRIMQNIVRPYDTVARYGGEEFSIILYDTDRQRAGKIAQRIREAVRNKTFAHGGREVKVTVSIGVATYPHDSPSLEDLVEMADRALYHAKGSGKDRVSSVPDIRL